jgi:hypothetical protein
LYNDSVDCLARFGSVPAGWFSLLLDLATEAVGRRQDRNVEDDLRHELLL